MDWSIVVTPVLKFLNKIWEWYKRPNLIFTRIEPFEIIDKEKKIIEYRVYIKNKGKSTAKNVKPEITFIGEGEISRRAFELYEPCMGKCKVTIKGKVTKPIQINPEEEQFFVILREVFSIVMDLSLIHI